MGVNAMKAIITYDCKCDYCGRSLTSLMSSYEEKPKSKRELNKVANKYGWFCDSVLHKNVCTDMKCKIARYDERNLIN